MTPIPIRTLLVFTDASTQVITCLYLEVLVIRWGISAWRAKNIFKLKRNAGQIS